MRLACRADRVHDLVDAARVEELPVQRERFAVVAKIEPKDLEGRGVEARRDRQDVGRIRATLPAVQQDREAAARGRRRAVEAEQSHSVAAVEDLGPGRLK